MREPRRPALPASGSSGARLLAEGSRLVLEGRQLVAESRRVQGRAHEIAYRGANAVAFALDLAALPVPEDAPASTAPGRRRSGAPWPAAAAYGSRS